MRSKYLTLFTMSYHSMSLSDPNDLENMIVQSFADKTAININANKSKALIST